MRPEVSVARRGLTGLVLAALLFVAVVAQLTVVNRLPLPGATAPDLVLLLVTAIAVTTTPAVAALTGFAGGLALDLAPPAAHYAGEYALVFCVVCYAASRVNHATTLATGTRDPRIAFTIMAVAAAAGEAGKAAIGTLLSDPDVTTAAVSRVLPGAILYDLLLSPLAFLLVARIRRVAHAERAPAPEFSRDQRLASVFRQASVGAAPNLHLAGTGASYGSQSPARRLPHLRLAGTGASYGSQSPARRLPHLRLAGTGKNYVSRTPAAGRRRKLNFAGDLPVRHIRAVRTPGKNWLRSAASPAVPAAKLPVRTPGKNWLRSSTSPAVPAVKRSARNTLRPRVFASGSRGVGRAGIAPQVPRTAAEALAARSAPSGLSALSGAGTRLAAGRSPRPGWLSGSGHASRPAVRRNPRTGWLGSSRGRSRTVIGSGVAGRPRAYASAPSTAWLRRSRNPWRKRSQRLFRMMGVGK